MNKTASHSNTPTFKANESQTSARLYQHPTAKEMQSKKSNIFSNFCAVLLLVIIAVTTGYSMGVASDKEAVNKIQAMESK